MMAQDVFDIIKNKEFHELSVDEMKEVMECCETQDEFYSMKNVLNEVDSMMVKDLRPSGKTKENLDMIFDEVHSTKTRVWYSSIGAVIIPMNKPIHKQPLMYIAAMLVALFFIYPFGGDQFNTNQQANPTVAVNQEVQEEPIQTNENTQAEVMKDMSIQDLESAPLDRIMDETSIDSRVADPIMEPSLSLAEAVAATQPGTGHPDGVFSGLTGDLNSVPVSKQPDVLDLLTVTF